MRHGSIRTLAPLPSFFDPIYQSKDHDGTAKDGRTDESNGGFDHALLRRGEAYT